MGSLQNPEKHGLLEVMSEDEGYSSEGTPTRFLLEKETGFRMPDPRDVEAQKTLVKDPTTSGKHAAEYSVPAATKYAYLGLYFGLNLGLTLFNKAVLGKVSSSLDFQTIPRLTLAW